MQHYGTKEDEDPTDPGITGRIQPKPVFPFVRSKKKKKMAARTAWLKKDKGTAECVVRKQCGKPKGTNTVMVKTDGGHSPDWAASVPSQHAQITQPIKRLYYLLAVDHQCSNMRCYRPRKPLG